MSPAARKVRGAVTSLLAITGLGVLLGVAGCVSGLHSDAAAVQVYVLRAAGPPTAAPTGSPVASLHVAAPIAGPGLSSDHIMLVQSDHRMSYFSASRWPATLPKLVESLAVESLRGSSNWTAVQDSSGMFASDYLLQIVIRRFEADYTTHADAPEVRVVLDCTLGKRTGRELMGTFVAEGSAVAAANRLGEVVAAFEAATNQALGSMAAQSAQIAQRAQTAQKIDAPLPSSRR